MDFSSAPILDAYKWLKKQYVIKDISRLHIVAGQFVNVAQIVTNASREGARQASRVTVTNESEVESAVQGFLAEAFPGVPTEDLNAALTVEVLDSAGTDSVD